MADRNSANIIRAELIGADTCVARTLKPVRSSAPVLAMCRALVAFGHDPTTPLEVFRRSTLCLRVRSIGAAAGLEINARGTGFIARCAVRIAPQVGGTRNGAAP